MNEITTPEIMPPAEPMRKGTIFAVVAFAVVCALALVWYYYNLQNQSATVAKQYPTFGDYYVSTRKQNPDYDAAETATLARDYAKALPLYKAALTRAQGAVQKEQIKFMIAITTSRMRNYMAAIPLYKEVATGDNSDATRLIRSYAVQTMSNQYEIFSDPRILDEIFKDQPYASLRVTGDTQLSLRHLNEYAASIYPTAESEFKIAEWYAVRLLQAKGTDPKLALPAGDSASYESLMHETFKLGEADLARLSTEKYSDYDITRGELRRATTLGLINRYGDMSLGDADDAFKATIELFAKFGPAGHGAIVRYSYAVHLAQMAGAARAKDIKAQLAPLYNNPDYANSMVSQFRAARQSSYNKNLAVTVAKFDPDFKRYLITLGWTEEDFKP